MIDGPSVGTIPSVVPYRLLSLLAISLLPGVAWAAPADVMVDPMVDADATEPAALAPVEAAPEAKPSMPVPDFDAPTPEAPAVTVTPSPAPEVAAPVVAPAPVVPPPRPTPAIDLPPRYELPPPRVRGTGMFVAAGLLGAVGAGYKLAGTISAIRAFRTRAFCLGPCGMSTLLGHSVVGTPLLVVSAGLLGGGMGMRGRWRAHEELFGNIPRDKKPSGTMPLRAGLGWGLFAGGVGLWAASRLIGVFACETDACLIGSWEATYYLSGAAVAAGMVLGPYASGHKRYSQRYGTLARQTSVTPMLSRDFSGLAVSGRF